MLVNSCNTPFIILYFLGHGESLNFWPNVLSFLVYAAGCAVLSQICCLLVMQRFLILESDIFDEFNDQGVRFVFRYFCLCLTLLVMCLDQLVPFGNDNFIHEVLKNMRHSKRWVNNGSYRRCW